MGDFFGFRTMVSSIIIKILYIAGVISIIISAFYLFFEFDFLRGFFVLIIGNLVWRLTCEAVIVIFSIHDKLSSIDSKTAPAYDPRSWR